MRVIVDRQLCKGHGVCMSEAPEVFEVSRSGDLTILKVHPDESLRKKVLAAVQYCPTEALSIRDDEGT